MERSSQSQITTVKANSLYRKPILYLFILSPAIGELLSGSSPPLEFFNPFSFTLLCSLYGSGALLVRDFARRWRRGWYSIVALGAAYGIIEEGIMVRSFFNPGWMDLGILGSYGRWLGVNWIWAEWLTIYHAIFSITLPIFLVESSTPQVKSEIWLSNRQRVLFSGLFTFAVLLGFIGFPYDAPAAGLAGCLIAVCLLVWLARLIQPIKHGPPNLLVSSRRIVLTGVSVPFVLFFFFTGLAPTYVPWPIIAMMMGLLIVFGYERLLRRWMVQGFTDPQRFYLASGGLGFFIVLSPILELNGAIGMTLVGLGFFILLYRLRRQMLVNSITHSALTNVKPLDLSS